MVTLVVGAVPAASSRGALARLGARERGATASPRARRALGLLTAAQLAISVPLMLGIPVLFFHHSRSLWLGVNVLLGAVEQPSRR